MTTRQQHDTRDEVTIHSTALVCQDTKLQGKITIGPGCIIHPRASILALKGEIVIGSGCMIEERAAIINRSEGVMLIGDGNVFMIGCRVESSVGDHNVFGARSTCAPNIRVSKHCNIGTAVLPLNSDSEGEVLPPYTVIYGLDSSRREWDGSGEEAERNLREKHLEYVREILPKYNRMRAVPT